MLMHAAEERFRRGLEALDHGRPREALALFETALELERRNGTSKPQARYLSFYGLSLAQEAGRVREGIDFCRQAVKSESYNADLALNLGRALLVAGRRREAHEWLLKGLALAPGHQGVIRELSKMGWRRRPPIPFLSRRNPLNVFFGRLTRTAPPQATMRATTSRT